MNDKHKSKGIAALLLSSGKHSPPDNIFTYKTILRYNQVLTVSTFSLIANREIKYIFKLFSRISSQIYLNPPRSTNSLFSPLPNHHMQSQLPPLRYLKSIFSHRTKTEQQGRTEALNPQHALSPQDITP